MYLFQIGIGFLDLKNFLQFTQEIACFFSKIFSSKWRPFENGPPWDAYLAYRVPPPLLIPIQKIKNTDENYAFRRNEQFFHAYETTLARVVA